MSNITKWEPFRDLTTMRKDMDRLFDEFFTMPTISQQGWSAPMVDMYQTENDIVVKATLPGLEPEDIDIQITGDLLTLRGETKQETVDEKCQISPARTPLPIVLPQPDPASGSRC